MTAYTARAERSGDWWAISVPELPGVFTQTKRLDQVTSMAQDAIALFLDVPVRSVQVELSISVDALVRADLDAVEDLRATAEVAAANYATAIRALVDRLNPKYSMRDIAALTGLSFQRVGQLLADKGVRAAAPAKVAVLAAKTVSSKGRAKAKVR
jgi:predicted RNase H-like HicB family nuclease